MSALAALAPATAEAALEVEAPARLGRYAVWELTLEQPESPARGNVWTTYFPKAEIVAPSGRAVPVDGFYYDTDTWKVRFSPAEEGRYAWSVTLGEDRARGAFEVYPSGRRGPLRVHPSNPRRLVHDGDGSLFAAFGFGGCHASNPTDPPLAPDALPNDVGFWINGDGGFDQDAYIQRTLLASGANLYRWSVANCSWPLWSRIDGEDDRYSVERGRWGDDWVRALRAAGIRVMMDVLGFGWDEGQAKAAKWPTIAPVEERAELLQPYLRYVVARYGAYVDIWELVNEYTPTDTWIREAVAFLHAIDPYRQDAACQRPVGQRRCRHPISISFSRPAHPSIEISSPHVYTDSDMSQDDLHISAALFDGVASEPKGQPMARFDKPVIIGEAGEVSVGPRAESRVGSRIKAWTAFFAEAALVFWEFGYVFHDGTTPGFVLTLDAPTRASLAAQRDFLDQVEADARPPRGPPPPKGRLHREVAEHVRVYDLVGDDSTYAYVVNGACAWGARAQGVSFDVDFAAGGVAAWYDPAEGRFFAPFSVAQGLARLTAPDFACDLALVAKPAFAPLVRAGPDRTVDLTAASALVLRGAVIDVDDREVATTWRVLEGPAASFADPTARTTSARLSAPGTYVIALEARDGAHTVVDTLTVRAAGIPRPGPDRTPPALSDTVVTVVLEVGGDVAEVRLDGAPTLPAENGRITFDVDVAAGRRRVVVEVLGEDGSRVRRAVTVDPEALAP